MGIHESVLPTEVLDFLQPERGGIFIDTTLGMGGHSKLILARAEQAKRKVQLIGIDQDAQALALAKELLGEKITYYQANFARLREILMSEGLEKVDGILADLGVSSYQLDTSERGFSFQVNGPLDMRMNEDSPLTAAAIINSWPEYKLANLFYQYGEERLSRKIARRIVEERAKQPFKETLPLANLITEVYPPMLRHKRPHPATRVFQALRLEVNRELIVLEDFLAQALTALNPAGVLAVISFHSLEDRIVKHSFRRAVEGGEYELLTKKPIMATEEEASTNPRSRSAKLRAIRRLAD